MADLIQVEQEQLANLQNKIYKVPFAVQDAVGLAQNGIQRLNMRLEEKRARCVEKLARAQDALTTCENTPPDRNGFRPSCHNERLAVERAQWQLHYMEGAIRDVRQAEQAHQLAAQRMLNFVQGPLMQAKAKLAEQIKYLQQYRSDSGGTGNVNCSPAPPPPSFMRGGGKESNVENREASIEGRES